jgi:hypothetical protein
MQPARANIGLLCSGLCWEIASNRHKFVYSAAQLQMRRAWPSPPSPTGCCSRGAPSIAAVPACSTLRCAEPDGARAREREALPGEVLGQTGVLDGRGERPHHSPAVRRRRLLEVSNAVEFLPDTRIRHRPVSEWRHASQLCRRSQRVTAAHSWFSPASTRGLSHLPSHDSPIDTGAASATAARAERESETDGLCLLCLCDLCCPHVDG